MPAARTQRTPRTPGRSSPRGPGQKAGLSRLQILDAALALVDRDGLAALTMRSLGAELGVEAMTLYHYVPTKDALLDGLVERAFTLAAPQADSARPWQEGLRDYAHGLYRGLLRHPGILPLASSRPAVTPDLLDRVEDYLRILTSEGFTLGQALHAINSVTLFVIGHATAAAQIGPSNASNPSNPSNPSGPSNPSEPSEPSEAGGAAWIAGLDAERYPLLVEAAGTGQGTDDDERFAFAIEALIAGLEPLSRHRSPEDRR